MDASEIIVGPSLKAVQGDGSPPRILACGGWPCDHGISIATLVFRRGTHLSGSTPGHLISFDVSPPKRLDCAIAGRRATHQAGDGSLSICPAGADCAATGDGDLHALALTLSPETVALTASEAGFHGHSVNERLMGRDDRLLALSQRLFREARAGHCNGFLYWSGVVDAVLDHVVSHHMAHRPLPRPGPFSRSTGKAVIEYIYENIGSEISLDELASVARCSRSLFSRKFRSTMGLTPHRFVMRARLNYAFGQLRTSRQPIADVAAESGFVDQSHLNRWMKHIHGVTPGDIRRESR